MLAKTDECADERVKICALFSFAQITLDALWLQINFADSPLDDENSPPAQGVFKPKRQKYAD